MFLTVYALVLAFLFLPASYQENESVAALANTYVIDELEREDIVCVREKAIKKLAAFNLLYLISNKVEVFCVDRALNLLEVAFEAYYDPPDLKTDSGFGPMGLDRKGYDLIDHSYNPDHETFCIIARQRNTNRLVVAFRGTSSKRHWNDNLKYSKRQVDLHHLPLALEDSSELGSLDNFPEIDDEDSAKHEKTPLPKFSRGTTIMEGAQLVTEEIAGGIKAIASTVIGATHNVVDKTTGLVVAITPGLKNVVNPCVHSGFWDAYVVVREFVHKVLRKELSKQPGHLCFTGHSLGGALATIAAKDFVLNSLPQVNRYIKHKSKIDCDSSYNAIQISMYNYGSPRVGNRAFSQGFNAVVPDGFRVIVDGDIVPSVPYSSSGYKHVGTEVLVDPVGAGSIIIDSSFVERRLRNHFKSSVSVHSLNVYRKGLLGVKEAAEFMNEFASQNPNSDVVKDSLKLALSAAPLLLTRSSLGGTVNESVGSPFSNKKVSQENYEAKNENTDVPTVATDFNTAAYSEITKSFSGVLRDIISIPNLSTWRSNQTRDKEKISKSLQDENVPRREYFDSQEFAELKVEKNVYFNTRTERENKGDDPFQLNSR